ncbi:MAG: asparagine synthase (glutamine-hydrolyzing) [Phenylobacterium sp.]|jgi:asparagine synthase (glutamine-hydrolysing)|uniref:asparagine synthase (glutamine-hydrolyzing) n=1 Tax=Phenylobacterium sp. TaxID=1871053 RepID=UPI002A36905D|nr:asparagine synthase (glutamine-hydrolyzing) [Phenylobacterium sp.]MDX9998757.1 asparagine synthase (glutamine-hydrolyzing) [Phenylobacterium sp.]
MCGIAGVLGAEGPVRPMIESLAHRGPDGVRWAPVSGGVLAHARLSIIDLEGGWQPLTAAGSTVVGNGEIYNYRELAAEFGLEGELSTGSDFEPLLHLYDREGPAAFARLRGMYAFCLVGGDGRTWLVRDPFGIKPLYLMEKDGMLAFASEPRAFVAAGWAGRKVDPEAAEELVGLNYVLGEKTLLKGVRRMPPGAVVEVTSGETRPLDRRPAWAPGQALPADERALLQGLDSVLENSVDVHQRSDVPYGLFLSGGIDSAAVATLMARLNPRPVTAFTCGFDAPGARDERAQAEKVARALGLDWRETRFGEEDFWRALPQVAWALDDPTADYATLPTWKLAEAAKGTLTVVLTGEGGDELFGGYGRYRRALRPGWLGGRPAEPRDARPEVLARWRAEAKGPADISRLQAAQYADIATWLPNDLLLKLDRCLMAHGLEGRTPFLDAEVAAFALALPDRFKVRGRWGKWLLRKWLERACPAAEPWARKQGFTVPVDAWIAPKARDIGERVAKLASLRALRSEDEIRAAFEGSTERWPLLFYAVWSLIHLEAASPADALAACCGSV